MLGIRRSIALLVVAAASACGTLTETAAVSPDTTPGGGDAATGDDAGAPAPDADAGKVFPIDHGVVCDSVTCDPSKDVCCVGLPPNNAGTGCLPLADAGACMGSVYECDDLADCARAPATICCGQHGSGPNILLSSRCLSTTECRQTDFPVVLCDPDSAQPCPGGEACVFPDGGKDFTICVGLP